MDVIQNFQIFVICFFLFLCSVSAFVLQSGLYMFHFICVELLLCCTNKPPEETTANNELTLDCRLAQHSMNRARCDAAVLKTDEQIVWHRRQEGCVFCPWGQSSARLSTTCDTKQLQPNLKAFKLWLSDGNLPEHFCCKWKHGANKRGEHRAKVSVYRKKWDLF